MQRSKTANPRKDHKSTRLKVPASDAFKIFDPKDWFVDDFAVKKSKSLSLISSKSTD